MKLFQKFFTGTALLSFSAFGLATSNLVGVWKGHLTVTTARIPHYTSAQQSKSAEGMKRKEETNTWTLTLKENHTFTVSDAQSKQPSAGKWLLSGNVIMLSHHNRTEKLMISKDGRTLSMTEGIITFTFKKA